MAKPLPTLRQLMPVLGGIGLLGPMANDTFLPALPAMAAWFAVPGSTVQLALGMMSVGMAVGQLGMGMLADRLGRRGPLLFGALLTTASAAAAALSGNVVLLIVACALLGFGSSSGMVIGRAIASDLAQGVEAQRAFAILGSLTGIGPVLGPLLGIIALAIWGWQGTFGMLTAFAAIATVVVFFTIPETLPAHARHTNQLRRYPGMLWSILCTRSYLSNSLLIWLGFGLTFGYISASSFVVQVILGWSSGVYALVFAINGLSMTAVGMLTGVLSHRLPRRTLLLAGVSAQLLGAILLSAALLGATPAPFLLLPGMWTIAIGMGFIFGPATAGAMVEMRDSSGTALALMGALQFAVAGITAPLVGVAGESSILPLAALALLCSLGGLITLILGRAYTR